MLRRVFLGAGFTAATATTASYLDRYHASTNQEPVASTEQYQYALTKEQKNEMKKFNRLNKKPRVVSLYDKEDGTTYADLAVEHLQSKGIEVVLVPSQEGMNHPVFKNPDAISGIYLPGGPDVPVADTTNPRKTFEGQLINMAGESDIPLLGICRGQQSIGHHHGAALQSLSDEEHESHYGNYGQVFEETENPNLNNKVTVTSGSQLYRALHRKLNQTNDDQKPIHYSVTCLHQQHLINHTGELGSTITVSGTSTSDGKVESIEKKTGQYYTYGLQHHPEAVISSSNDNRKLQLEMLQDRVIDSLIFDPEVTVHLHFTERSKIFKRSRDEIVARAELGLFTDQTKKKFLEHNQAPAARSSIQVVTIKPNSQS